MRQHLLYLYCVSVLHGNLLALHQRIAGQLAAVQIFPVHIHGGNLVVAVGGVVVNALVGVAAAGVKGDFVLAAVQLTAAALLLDRMQNVEKLPDALGLTVTGFGVHPHKGGADKAGLAGQIARQTQCAKPAAVDRQLQPLGKGAGRRVGRKCAVIVQRKKLLRERRIVRQHAHRVVINVQAVGGGLHHNAAGLVGNKPVQLGKGKLLTERNVDDVGLFQQGAGLGQRGAAAKQPGDKLKLGDVVFAFGRRMVDGVPDKVQPGNAEALLVDGIVVEGILPGYIGHTNHRILCAEIAHAAQAERIRPRRDGDLIAVGKLIIQIAPEVEILCGIRCSGTHDERPFLLYNIVLYHGYGRAIHR